MPVCVYVCVSVVTKSHNFLRAAEAEMQQKEQVKEAKRKCK